MKKIISILLVSIIFLLQLSGCGAERKLEGKWEAQLPYKTISDKEESFGQLSPYLDDLYDVTLSYYIEFSSGTYKEYYDTEKYLQDIKAVMKKAIDAFYTDLIAEHSLDMTLAEAMQLDRVTYDSLLDPSALDLLKEREGNFHCDGERLYLSADLKSRPDKEVYSPYTLSDDILTIQKPTGAKAENTNIFPITFKKVD